MGEESGGEREGEGNSQIQYKARLKVITGSIGG